VTLAIFDKSCGPPAVAPGLPYASELWLGALPTVESEAFAIPDREVAVLLRTLPKGAEIGVRINLASESKRY
jgi:hypothetical protein